MRLTYWQCECYESRLYNIKAKTKKEAVRLRNEYGQNSYGEPEKIILEFSDSFELMDYCTSEAGVQALQVN